MTRRHADVFLAVVALGLLATGCVRQSTSDPPAPPTAAATTSEDQPVRLPTNDWEPGGGAHQALISGTLAVDREGCVYLDHGGAARTYVTWPAGYTARRGAEGLRVLDSDGTEVARGGDSLEMGGGYTRDPAGTHPCLPTGHGEIGVVQSAVVVVATAAGGGGLPCPPEHRLPAFYDYSGPGRPTPEEAVAPFLGRLSVGVTRLSGDGRNATVTAVDAAGTVVREYRLTKASDGWWPDGYTGCESP